MDALIQALRERAALDASRTDQVAILKTPLFGVATRQQAEEAEQRLGFALPPLLKRLYLEIANGGFGPGYGIVGLAGGYADSDGRGLIELYELLIRSDPSAPPHWLPVVDWGCAIWSCIDCSEGTYRMITMDGGRSERTNWTLESWLADWGARRNLWSRMFEFEECEIANPFTGETAKVHRRARIKKGPRRDA